MTTCSGCGAETTRTRLIWDKDGKQREECRSCAPESFEKFTAPSDKKIWMGYEAHPNEYVKAEDGGYDRKPEYCAEQEQRLAQETEEEKTKRLAAEARKRAERRTAPMDSAELAGALAKAEQIANWLTASAAQGRDVN